MTDCIHHYRIETPSGESSKAVCLRCGFGREFQNYEPVTLETRGRKPKGFNQRQLILNKPGKTMTW